VVLAAGIWLVAGGTMEPAGLLVALLIGTLPIESILPLMYLNNFVNDSKAGAARIASVLALPELPEPTRPRPPRDGSVRFRGVTFGYGADRDRPALDGVDLDVPAGSVCALVGPSGSGKSTLARLVARFHDVDAGSVEVGGVDVREIGTPALLRHVALVFQDPFLVDDTVAENIRLGRPDATDAEVEAASRAAGAHEFVVSELPDGYATRVGERGGLLSGGQRQRLTIARAMLVDAPIVVLDEATAFADPEAEAAIQDSVAALTRGRTVIVIAHRLATVADADQIVVLADGRVAEHGTHDELLAAGGRYARMWQHHERARAWGVRG
jgi:ATP-binding cassette subfamily B protein